MPVFMQYDGVDGDVSRAPEGASGCDVCVLGSDAHAGNFATGETLVHVEAPSTTPIARDLIFGGDDSAADSANVEVMIKVLDTRPAHAQGETLVHVESGWLMA